MASAGALYRTGTVNLTSNNNKIIGVETSWLSAVNAIAVGDLFTIDMATWYEVLSVNSDDSITLDRAFEGATSPSVKYGILRNTSGTINTRIAGQIAVLLNQKQLFLDELTTWLNSSNESESITDSEGVSAIVKTPKAMTDEHLDRIANVNELTGSIAAMTKAEFDTQARNELQRHSVAGLKNTDFDSMYSLYQVNGWQNTFRINANTVKINGVWHEFDNQNVVLNDAPNGLQNIDLSQPDYVDLAAAIVAGGTSLSASYLNQRELVLITQEDVELTGANALSTAYIQDASNHVYSDNGVLRQKVFAFVVERLPESVDRASKNNFWADTINAMTALGWTENTSIKGQWEKGGLSATAISWVQRENQGAGHPINPQGCASMINHDGTNVTQWHNPTINGSNNATVASLFQDPKGDPRPAGLGDKFGSSGNIGGFGPTTGRYNNDGKLFDAIYPEQIHSLAVSAKKQDLSTVLFNGENAAVSARLRGQESVPFTEFKALTVDRAGFYQTYWYVKFTTQLAENVSAVAIDNVYIQTAGGTIIKATHESTTEMRVPVSSGLSAGDTVTLVRRNPERSKHTTANPTWTDIIGTPANIAATAENLGVDGFYGTWAGEALSTGEVKLTRKLLDGHQAKWSADSGDSWTVSASAFNDDTTENTVKHPSLFNSTNTSFMHYKTQAHFTDESNSLAVNKHGRVCSMGRNEIERGCLLNSTLTGNISTDTVTGARPRFMPLTFVSLRPDSMTLDPSTGLIPKHDTIELDGTGAAVKNLTSTVEVDGLQALQFTFKEMVYDSSIDLIGEAVQVTGSTSYSYSSSGVYTLNGVEFGDKNGKTVRPQGNFTDLTADAIANYYLAPNGDFINNGSGAVIFKQWDGYGWGDDNKFQITDGTDTTPDENGNTVIYGTHTHVLNIPTEDF